MFYGRKEELSILKEAYSNDILKALLFMADEELVKVN